MISVVVFSYSETLKSMLVEYADTEIIFLDDYSDTDPYVMSNEIGRASW